MPNIANVLKAEIIRLARKEVRDECSSLKKTVATQRTENAALKRRVQALEAVVKRLSRSQDAVRSKAPTEVNGQASEAPGAGTRFSAKGLAANRQRLELSAADFGRLLGVSGQSIYAWEAGKARPRAEAVTAIAALRSLGKREAASKLDALKG
jgi:DNA-binding transcriptional regulator YiaG